MKVLKLILLLIFVSCYNKEELFSMECIREFSSPPKEKNINNEIVEISIVDIKDYVFVKICNSKKIAKIPIEDLYAIYENYYIRDFSFDIFLYEVLNFKMYIPYHYINEKNIFSLNVDIMNKYNDKGIEGIKSLYTTEEKKGKFFINPTIEYNYIVTIQYLFYINKYEYYNDDYIPLIWFEKSKDFTLYKK